MGMKAKCRRVLFAALMVALFKFGKLPKTRGYLIVHEVEFDAFFAGTTIFDYHEEDGRIVVTQVRRDSGNIHHRPKVSEFRGF